MENVHGLDLGGSETARKGLGGLKSTSYSRGDVWQDQVAVPE
jgi:hypothetical protein